MNLLKIPKSTGFILVFVVLFFVRCEEFVEIDPPRTEIANESLFTSDQGANAAINGLYSQLVEVNTENILSAGFRNVYRTLLG